MRGYVITGDVRFLDTYLAVRGSVSPTLDDLRRLAAGSAGIKHLDALAPLVLTIHSRAGVIETVNPAAERMFGYPAVELIGKTFSYFESSPQSFSMGQCSHRRPNEAA